MTIPLLSQIRRLPSLIISLPGSVSTNLWQFGLTTAWELPNFVTPKPGAVGGDRCVGGPATAGRLPMGWARLAGARLRRFEVFGVGVRCCSVSSRRHAVSGSVPKARRRPFRCDRVPSRRTRLLVALERRGSGRLSDGEGLHEPLGGRGEDLQDVETLLPRGRHDGPEERENPRALEGPEAAGDLHLDLHHPQISFGEVVGEGHVE